MANSESPLYFRLERSALEDARRRLSRDDADLGVVLSEVVTLLEVLAAERGQPGTLERKRDRLYPMLRALNALAYSLQRSRSWDEVAKLLAVPVVRRKPGTPTLGDSDNAVKDH